MKPGPASLYNACMSTPVRQRIVFTGHVQGVGFRFTTVRLARGFEVAGTVRNLPDGRVEVVAEGPPAQIDAFVDAVREAMSGYIRHVERQTESATGGFSGFDVAF